MGRQNIPTRHPAYVHCSDGRTYMGILDLLISSAPLETIQL
jgi:hypothetical protein